MGDYKRKTTRKLVFTEELMKKVKQELLDGKPKRQIARELNINESTLRKRLKVGTVPVALGRYRNVFSTYQENELGEYIREMDKRFYGVTRKDLKMLAFEYAEVNKINHVFNKDKQVAGDKWVRNFCKRQNIALRQPEKCSMGRIIGFNKPQIERFFTNLKILYENFNFSPSYTFNVDETGLNTVPNKQPKVLAEKGKRLVGKVSSGERGQLITAVCCMSASGTYIPPALVFPRKRFREDLYRDAPTGTLKLISDTGFVNADLFLEWIKHFKQHAQPTSENPALLILDNHVSHRSLKVISYCKENFIHLLSLPPHASHKLQPLDVGFFAPLKVSYSQICDNWLVSNPGRVITQTEVAGLFKQAYYKVANIEKAVNSFAATGIYPYNPDIFSDEDFAPSLVTDKQIIDECDKENGNEGNDVEMPIEQFSKDGSDKTLIIEENVIIEYIDEAAATSVIINSADQISNGGSLEDKRTKHQEDEQDLRERKSVTPEGEQSPEEKKITQKGLIPYDKANGKDLLSPKELRPYPKAQFERTRKRKSQKSEILTSTPFKSQLEETEANQKLKLPKKQKKIDVRRRLVSSETPNNQKPQEKSSNTDEIFCPGCSDKFQDPPLEDWIQCCKCEAWWHEACTYYSGGLYTCDFCT